MKASDYLLFSKEALAAYNKMCEPILTRYHLGQVSFDILMFLANNPEFSTAQDISRIRNIKKNLVSIHVEKLANEGYLQRHDVPGDRRKVALSCTAAAQPIIRQGQALQKAYFDQITDGISAEEMELFKTVQEKIIRNTRNVLKEEHYDGQ